MIKYLLPHNWIQYDPFKVVNNLMNAKAAVLSLTRIPYQRSWVEKLQDIQLKREVAGTSRIEGADFTEKELDAAMKESPDQLLSRSQKQAAAAVGTYRWINNLPNDRQIDASLIFEVHKHIIVGADDDHCPSGVLRNKDINVTFGIPPHRGAEGGDECKDAFDKLCFSLSREFQSHDPLVQALAFHYHFASIHPFHDGNGRTARALEALMLQRTGLRDSLFIAMSNYYYEEKTDYLKTLAQVRAASHDLTDFLIFGLRGIELQCQKLFGEIKKNVAKALFKNTMHDLFNRLSSPKKSVIRKRQLTVLELLLENEQYELDKIIKQTEPSYKELNNPINGLIRDLNYLINLGAITAEKIEDGKNYRINVSLDWPTTITESKFFESVKTMPKRKTLII